MIDTSPLYYQSVDLLKKIIAIPSLSKEEDEVVDMLEKYLQELQLTYKRYGNNLLCSPQHYRADKPNILLNSHVDTVKPVAAWQRNPFEATEEEGKIYGLGSTDAGASLVSLLHVFYALQSTQQAYNMFFLASCEEEISGKNGVESVLPYLPEISFALVGEPTQMHPAIAEKGLMVLDCTAHGKSGHAAREEGENAIYLAMKSIDWFASYEFPKVSERLGKVKMTVTLIQAGTQHNVVPDKCTFTVDVRTNECYSNQEVFELIKQQAGCEVKARSFRLNSSQISQEHPFVQRAISLGKQPFGSPTLSDQALLPFPSLKMGPGNSARSHTADEYCLLEEIREALVIYITLLDGLNGIV